MDEGTISSFIMSVQQETSQELNRMDTPWNNLTKEIALAQSVNSLKRKQDLYLENLNRNNHVCS